MAIGVKKQNTFLPIFILFVVLSVVTIFLSQEHLLFGINFFENAVFPIEGFFFQTAHAPSTWFEDKQVTVLQTQNRELTQELVKMQKIQQDNSALYDQFETTAIPSTNLLPATVIGAPEFIPGVTMPETFIINRGTENGIKVGQTVVYKTNLIGSIIKVTGTAAQVRLISNKATSFTAKTSGTNAQGVLTGQGNGVMILGSVVLSEKLHVGDIIVTNGSQDLAGRGFPPGLIVGKVVSIDKNPSSLYQSASVESLLNLSKLSTVFVME